MNWSRFFFFFFFLARLIIDEEHEPIRHCLCHNLNHPMLHQQMHAYGYHNSQVAMFSTPFLAATVLLWEFASWASSGIADHCCCKQYVANNYCIFFWIESIALTLEINESLATLEINESLATNKFLLHGRCTSMHITVYITPYMYNRKYTPNIGKIPPFIDAYKRKTLYRHINMWFYLDIVTV